MAKKLVRKVVRDTFEVPGEIVKTAAEQVGVIPQKKEEEPELSEEELEERRKKDEAIRKKRLAEIEEEIKHEVEKRKAIKVQSQQAEEAEKKKRVEEIKPLEEPKAKRPRGLLMGLKRRWEKFRPEWAGRRVGG